MIFLSLGTHEQPFSRAISLLRPIAETGEKVVIQHGFTPRDPSLPNAVWEQFVDYGEMVDLLLASRGFICHAGVGSVLTALTHGITPVLVPRKKRHGEHVDDHQLQLATKLADRRLVVLLEGIDPLTAVNDAARMRGRSRTASEALRRAVQRATARVE